MGAQAEAQAKAQAQAQAQSQAQAQAQAQMQAQAQARAQAQPVAPAHHPLYPQGAAQYSHAIPGHPPANTQQGMHRPPVPPPHYIPYAYGYAPTHPPAQQQQHQHRQQGMYPPYPAYAYGHPMPNGPGFPQFQPQPSIPLQSFTMGEPVPVSFSDVSLTERTLEANSSSGSQQQRAAEMSRPSTTYMNAAPQARLPPPQSASPAASILPPVAARPALTPHQRQYPFLYGGL